jgi:hypothetical protein
MSFLITVGIITLILTLIIRWLLRRYRGLLYFISPKRID